MAERKRKPDQHSDLQRARAAARATERAAALSDRVEAFGRLGFGAPSLDATGPADA